MTQNPSVLSPPKTRFDFDTVVDRSHSNSLKWGDSAGAMTDAQAQANPLPMWVADMDFKSPPAVISALHEAVSHGVYGYAAGMTKGYVDAVVGWQQKRFGWDVPPGWVVPIASVIAALKTIVQAFSQAGDSVLIQPPVYAHFHHDVLINGRHVTTAPLQFDGQRYRFDAKVFENAICDNTKIFILSNPHNPTGNVWTEDELCTMGEICLNHGVLVIADEIHCDLVFGAGRKHTPFASLDRRFARNSITCTSASKTFNLAGLQCGNMLIADKIKRDEVVRTIERNHSTRINLLGMVATEAAFTHGADWVDELVAYIAQNQRHFAERINALDAGLKVIDMEALYLAWIDCRALGMTPEQLEDFMLVEGRVWLDRGPKFGVEGHGFMRANLGCPRQTVDLAVERISKALTQR
ncbi:MalY/PatB family protein [Ralstonia pseudosolanacearum]|uniref:cysteine-S-conjugate beta-lyase n=1 Tax=Ralstonia solanacearum TaxID=305 RepID=A0AA92JQZ3_RALSL|nr:MalY/PatB family protein [Ralstonia pseudosolanacearum]QOK91240.1 pyridoxal phosphate-dependent aminotransferase [Ralstonia pseudosolanacearum]QOK96120.1 pyridoxal phosphate-dependent aminotransferase [Ralstonia pseudosolanacearum]UWD90013.1 pyridoxal phosphate-dependent aminotransferase [Ralstonia pseudosolanacearum]CAH0440564.1 Cystathionine beta-lyase PatB [Ralstonia pseudosolanacearum]